MSTPKQRLNLRGLSMAPENLSVTFDDIFTQFVSILINFFQYLSGLFNRPDTPRHWLDVAAPYLLAAASFFTCLCLCHCLFSCISCILIRCFNAVRSCCGGRSEEKMMIAPGRSPWMLRRAAFEANPRGYFRDSRGQTNDFVY